MRENKGAILCLFFLFFAAFVNALGNDFVSDDKGLILHIPSYTIENLITQPFFFFRSFIFLVLYEIAGFNSFVFRLPNFIFHIGSVWLIFVLISILKNRTVGFLAAGLFAVHPILVESVTWISGGAYVQYTFFFLLSFLLYVLSESKKKLYIWSIIVFIISLLSSEKAVVLFLIFPLFEFCFGNLRKHWKKTSIFSFLCIMYLFLSLALGRLGTKISSLQADHSLDQGLYNPLIQIPVAISSYLQLIFWPDGLTMYHSEMSFGTFEYGIRAVFCVVFFGVVISIYKWSKQVFFWLCFFLIALLPTLTPLGISWIVAERYVYLGSLGIFVVVGLMLGKIAEKKTQRMTVYTVFSLIIIACIMRTIVRNNDWKNEDNLWLAAARTSPSSSQNHNNLGDYYGRQGDVVNAAREFQKAIELKPDYADAHHNLGNAYRDMGKANEALESYEKALSINPKLWQSYQNIASIYFINKDYKRALLYLEKGLTVSPNNINLLAGMGQVYFDMGDKDKARSMFTKILEIDPQNNTAKQALLQIEENKLQ